MGKGSYHFPERKKTRPQPFDARKPKGKPASAKAEQFIQRIKKIRIVGKTVSR
jgi:hypothetical protein